MKQQDIANQFNQHFINVGPSLAELIDDTNVDPTSYIKKTPSSSFVMSPVNEADVSLLFSRLKSDCPERATVQFEKRNFTLFRSKNSPDDGQQ